MLVLLAVITFAAAISQYLSFNRMQRYVAKELQFEPTAYMPRLSVILPCKGVDPGFAGNIEKLLKQDYCDEQGKAKFEVVFAVAGTDDPAYPILQRACASQSNVATRLVVAGTNPRRAQKVNNQLTALETISPDSEALVFVDSDVIARNDFLRYLVAKLDHAEIGATTGYRFYIPFKGDWPSLIRSLWNRMTAWELADPNYAFAWGGAMACTRETFLKARIKENWDLSADDDLALTTAIKKLGLRIHFVPQCLVATHGDATLPEIVEWTNRQLILTKVYYPELWRRAIRKAIVLTVWLCAVAYALLKAALTHDAAMVQASVAGMLLIPIELAFLAQAQGLWQSVMQFNSRSADGDLSNIDQHTDRVEQERLQVAYNKSLWRFSTVLPLAHLILPWMTLYSVVTNRIKWRGVTYELRSPTETLII